MTKNEIKKYIRDHFPNTPTEIIAKKLGLSIHQVRKIASQLKIKKDTHYLKELQKNLVSSRRKWYLKQIPVLKPTFIQEQIIFGSLLGDGGLTKGTKRSRHCSYKEHFSPNQLPYRKWKQKILSSLGFHFTHYNHLRSYSHPYFSKLYRSFYKDNLKIVPRELLPLMTHPIFLATLYMDDGSLILSHRPKNRQNIIYVHPTIVLYTLNFSKGENEMLANHLNETFKTKFVLSKHPHGNHYILKLNKVQEVEHFLSIVKPYVSQIPEFLYKYDLKYRLKKEQEKINSTFSETVQLQLSSSTRKRPYTNKEIKVMTTMKKEGYTDQEIADQLNRTYWSIVYKFADLRKSVKNNDFLKKS
ncbi:DNA endonuclease [Microaerobacter geothermalis]|uniref:DNA endonuclease n=1 Tax=Microaerobacter geothermalis TaxID=674972 RepID=UPI001F42DF11|nr:DNA endonuclease [Microaerobacter geothermalis]MCF6093422.1 DNA endonuclease [Microaerobacter geothermalis]